MDWTGADEMVADRRLSHVKMVQITQGLTEMLDRISKSQIQPNGHPQVVIRDPSNFYSSRL